MTKNNRRKLVGEVISTRMKNTIVVKIDSIRTSRLYRKKYTVTRKIKAHTNDESLILGDIVEIESSRPISKTKRFIFTEKVK